METLLEDEHNGVYLLKFFLQNDSRRSEMHLKIVSVKSASFIGHPESSKEDEVEINPKTSLKSCWCSLKVLRQEGDAFPQDLISPWDILFIHHPVPDPSPSHHPQLLHLWSAAAFI